jgi:N-hydroxyarylamine O-acetyltransferase
MLDVNAYLKRIGYNDSTVPDAETLRKLHRAHLLAVPFENLDIPSRSIVLDRDAIVHKIVQQKRGGFCYELNGAFAALLAALGFRVTLLSARVARPDGSEGPEFDHLALRVDLDEAWLADVGFGELFLEPIRLTVGHEQQQGLRAFRISAIEDRLLLEHRDLRAADPLQPNQRESSTEYGLRLEQEKLRAAGESKLEERGPGLDWKPDYSFMLLPRRLEDFAEMCHYHQTSPKSHFTQKRLCSLARENGRITLSDMRLMIRTGEVEEGRVLASDDEWRATLKRLFGVVLET